MLRVCFIISALTALGLAGWAAVLALRPAEPEPPARWVLEDADRDLGELPVGSYPLTFRVTNEAPTARRVVGLAEGCWLSGCYCAQDHGQVVVPAGGTASLEGELTLKKVGPFEVEIDIHLEENGIRTIPVKIRGVALSAMENHHASPSKP